MPENIFSRRGFLNVMAASLSSITLMWPSARAGEKQQPDQKRLMNPDRDDPKIGIALGAGGANGLAHILMLEALDELSIRPHCISGSSIGAIIGALYASGMTAKEIRGVVEQFIIRPEERIIDELLSREALRWVEFIEIDLGNGGLLSSEGFISFLFDILEPRTFEKLEIPLKITAADLWGREQVVMQSGDLLAAIKASMALPGVFQPVIIDKRVLVDGGTVNPVPYDLLTEECDLVIGIDVSGERTRPETPKAGYFETIFNSAKVMQRAIMTEKLRHNQPAIYIAPRIVDVRALEFYRAKEVFNQSAPAKQELKRRLSKLLKV